MIVIAGVLGGAGLFELEHCAAYNLIVDLNIDAIGTDSERARVQVVDVLTAINSEVGTRVGGHAVSGLVDVSRHSSSRPSYSDSCWWQVASRNTVLGQTELHRNDPAPNSEDGCPVSVNWRLHLRRISWSRGWGRCRCRCRCRCSCRCSCSCSCSCSCWRRSRGRTCRCSSCCRWCRGRR